MKVSRKKVAIQLAVAFLPIILGCIFGQYLNQQSPKNVNSANEIFIGK